MAAQPVHSNAYEVDVSNHEVRVQPEEDLKKSDRQMAALCVSSELNWIIGYSQSSKQPALEHRAKVGLEALKRLQET